jgi:oligopeptidase A
MHQNPLFEKNILPPFSAIKPQDIAPAIEKILLENREQLVQLLAQKKTRTWDNLLFPLEELSDRLAQAWSPVSHMNAVVNEPALREAYNTCLPLLSDYHTEVAQNEDLYEAIEALVKSEYHATLNKAQQRVLEDLLRDFRLSGIHLKGADREIFKRLSRQLSELTARFEENILDATQAWQKLTTISELAGLPQHALDLAQAAAKAKGWEGYLITLEFPSYFAVMMYATSRALREEVYRAYVTRASELGEEPESFDNTPIIDELVKLRYEMAKLVGFETYAHYSLATKMAESPEAVLAFLEDLVTRTHSKAKAEFQDLEQFAKAQGITTLMPWDVGYYSEKYRQACYDFDQEIVRPYFQLPTVLTGMFDIVHRLYGMTVTPLNDVDVWHKDVMVYQIHDEQQEARGIFYCDLYAREGKRGGAWMDECRVRRRLENGEIQQPVAYLTCNFSPPTAGKPALLTHDEVQTLFHEFGHGLHHMLTRVEYADVSGINGVPWDAVELPSQFFENWCWQETVLEKISSHVETKEILPKELFDKMVAAKNFQSAMGMARQLEFALFDFRLYYTYQGQRDFSVQKILDEVRAQVAVVKAVEFNRFQHSFSHIFAGGYSAGYYSYKWAEVLSSDAFSLFEEEGVLNKTIGRRFLETFLEQGGTRDPMDLFIEFRGRKPEIEALLRHSGLSAQGVY